jgi:hypothetical protein
VIQSASTRQSLLRQSTRLRLVCKGGGEARLGETKLIKFSRRQMHLSNRIKCSIPPRSSRSSFSPLPRFGLYGAVDVKTGTTRGLRLQ